MDAIASLKHVFLVLQNFGFFPFGLQPKNGSFVFFVSKRRLLYTKFLLFVFTMTQIYSAWFRRTVNTDLAPGQPSKTVLAINSLSVPLAIFLIFQAVLRKNDLFCFWLNKLNDLFSNLTEKRLKSVRRLYWLSFAYIFVSTMAVIISGFYAHANSSMLHQKPKTFLHRPELMLMLHHFVVCEIKLFVQVFLLFLNLLRHCHEETRRVFETRGKNPISNKIFWLGLLRRMRKKDLAMADFVDFLQAFYMPVFWLQFVWSFSTTLFNWSIGIRYGIPTVVQVVWVIYVISDILMVIVACHYTEAEAQKMPHYVHKMLLSWDDKILKKEIIASLTSYTVMLMQFQYQTGEE